MKSKKLIIKVGQRAVVDIRNFYDGLRPIVADYDSCLKNCYVVHVEPGGYRPSTDANGEASMFKTVIVLSPTTPHLPVLGLNVIERMEDAEGRRGIKYPRWIVVREEEE